MAVYILKTRKEQCLQHMDSKKWKNAVAISHEHGLLITSIHSTAAFPKRRS